LKESKSVTKTIERGVINYSKISDKQALTLNHKEFFLDLERVLSKDDDIGKSKESTEESIDKYEHMSEEKYFWLLRETLMNKMKNLGLKIHDIDQKTRTQDMKLPEMEKKQKRLSEKTEQLGELKEKNKNNETNLNEIISQLPDLKEKRILSEEEVKQMKAILHKLEEKSIQEINEQIQNTQYRFSLKRRNKRT
jgi:hypothetical protein